MTVAGRSVFAKAERQETEFVAGLASRLPEADVAAARAVVRRIRELLAEGEKHSKLQIPNPRKIPSSKSQYGTSDEDHRSTAREETEEKPVPEADESELPYNLL